MDVPYIIEENLSWWVLLVRQHSKKNFGGSKPSSKLTLKTKRYHSYACRDDSQSSEQLKKHVTDKYFEKKVDFEP